MCKWYEKIHIYIVNSKLWHHVYYKHTTEHKTNLMNIGSKARKIKKAIIAKRKKK